MGRPCPRTIRQQPAHPSPFKLYRADGITIYPTGSKEIVILNQIRLSFLAFLVFNLAIVQPTRAETLHLDRLPQEKVHLVKNILKTLKPGVDQIKPSGAMNLLTFGGLYDPLSLEEKAFLDEIRKIDPKNLGATAHAFEPVPQDALFVKIPDQKIQKDGTSVTLPKQYLSQEVYDAYQKMMDAMEEDLEKTLYVESGYRSPAYQLYLFLRYLPKHGYSIRENNRFVALPGHSEHGAPQKQAIDFINEEGINGEDNPEEFEVLPEYKWLTRHAKIYGFVLSYPRGNDWGTSFEPWHWHYEKRE